MPIKDRSTSDDHVTLVVRDTECHSLDYLKGRIDLGKCALISDAEIIAHADGDALARLEVLDDPASPIHSAVSLLEHAADKLEASGADHAARPYRLVADQIRQIIGVPKPGLLGVDALSSNRSTTASERGADLLLAVERVARRVIQRELVCGGLIARAIIKDACS